MNVMTTERIALTKEQAKIDYVMLMARHGRSWGPKVPFNDQQHMNQVCDVLTITERRQALGLVP